MPPSQRHCDQADAIASENIVYLILDGQPDKRFTDLMLLSGIALTCSGLAVALTAELAARGVLRRNGGAGIRIASVMRTEDTWKAGHRAARWWMHGAAMGLGGAGILSFAAAQGIAEMGLLVGMAGGLALLLIGAFVAHRTARGLDDAAEERTADHRKH